MELAKELQITLFYACPDNAFEALRGRCDAAMLAPLSVPARESRRALELTADGLWSEVSARLQGALNVAT